MNAEIIAVGSELLLGQIANTNAQYISKCLADIGVNVFYHTVVGDNEHRLTTAIKTAKERSDLLIFTGGLGPTKDDLTKETISDVFHRELEYDQEALESIKSYFIQTGREMTPNNEKQALIVKDSVVLRNENGMAPGMAFRADGITCILLPGPPSEMRPMFEKYAIPYLVSDSDVQTRLFTRVLRFFGIGESILETKIQDLIDQQTNPTIAPLASEHEVTIRLTASHHDENEALKLLTKTEEEIVKRVPGHLYGYDEDSLEDQTIRLLKEKGLTVASAESLTGGLFGKVMTDRAGASKVYMGGITAYATDLKESLLSVPKEILLNEGAVSKKCAEWMAIQIKRLAKADIGISFTGVAGPDKQEEKDPGTVFIAIAGENDTKVFPLKLGGTRKAIRERTVKHGFYLLNQLVKERQ